jgi:hypothetical protein
MRIANKSVSFEAKNLIAARGEEEEEEGPGAS